MAFQERYPVFSVDNPGLRRSSVIRQFTAPDAAAHVLVQASESRIGIIFFAPTTSLSVIAWGTGGVDAAYLRLTPAQAQTELWFERHGSIVQDAWNSVASASGVLISWMEVFSMSRTLSPEMLYPGHPSYPEY